MTVGRQSTSDWGSAPSHAPIADTQATASRAAAGPRRRNVCTGLVVTFCAGPTAPSAATVTVAVIDGATGGSTYLWGPIRLALPAVAGAVNGVARAGLWLVGSVDTPMTIEFSGASGVNTFQAVAMEGVTIPS